MKNYLCILITLITTLQISCVKSDSVPKLPTADIVASGENKTPEDPSTAPSSPTPPTRPEKPTPYEEASKGRCVKSWNWKSSSHLICLNQGYYAYFNIVNSTPKSFTLDYISRLGTVTRYNMKEYILKSGEAYKITLATSSGNKMSFDGIDFSTSKTQPDAGYVLLGGNSGTCAPIVAGTFEGCLKEIQKQGTYGDSIWIDSFSFPEGSFVNAGTCTLKAFKSVTSTVAFTVSGGPCSINGRNYNNNNSVEFDLRNPSNFPELTQPILY